MVAPARVVHRHSSVLGAWEMVEGPPAPALRGHVARYCDYRERTPEPLRRREVATSIIPLILSFEQRIRVLDPERPERIIADTTSFAAGLAPGPAVTEHGGVQQGVQVDLTPTAARRLLGVPMHELAGRIVPLEDVLGRPGRELVDRLADAPGAEARFALLDEAIGRRLAETAPPPPGVAWALARLRRTHGGVPVTALAAETGWSRRHLGDRFRDHVGVTPKPLARILRFEHVVRRAAEGAEALADVAYACGFADQAHLNREFRALAGVTPTRFLADRLPDGGGVAG